MKTSTTFSSKKIIKIALATLTWVLVWFLFAQAIGQELILPSPVTVLKRLGGMIVTAEFWKHTGLTFLRIVSGYLIGVLMGFMLAMLTFNFEICDTLLAPIIRIIRATPVASFIILILLWVGKNTLPMIVVALMVTPVIWENLISGFENADSGLLQMADSYNFTRMKKFWNINVMSAIPAFTSAALTSMGLAWKSGIASEVLSQPGIAIGTQLYNSKVYLETPELFAWTIVVILLSLCIEKMIRVLVEKKLKENSDEN